MLEFEWDPEKTKANLRKHGVSSSEAATVFRDLLGITVFDPDHSRDEDRYLTFGTSERGRVLVIAHTDRGDKIRIISVRELTRAEREQYEKEITKRQK